jgi:hypothetical protein
MEWHWDNGVAGKAHVGVPMVGEVLCHWVGSGSGSTVLQGFYQVCGNTVKWEETVDFCHNFKWQN